MGCISIIFLLVIFLYQCDCYCEPGVRCDECELITNDDVCYVEGSKVPNFYCNVEGNSVKLSENSYFYCLNGRWFLEYCENGAIFDIKNNDCYKELSSYKKKVKRSSGGARAGDICQFNTDCQSGMFCSSGSCTCLSDYVSISGYCWPKVNPGQSGCHEDKQCSVVWPNTKCSSSGVCECSEGYVPSRTRDGTVCITASVPPACPLPESLDDEPNPVTILGNSKNHPLSPGNYMPVLCTSTSTEVHNSNGGDGSTWCIYPDGENDIYIADIYDCLETPLVNNELFKEYAPSVNGICCPSRAFVCIQPMEQGNEPSVPRWYYNSISGACSQFMWDPNSGENVSPNNFKTQEHCETYCGSCKRGPTQYYTSKHTIFEDTPITNCMQSSTCSGEFKCTLVGSTQACCPSISNICSPLGGRPHFVKPLGMSDRGVLIHGSKTVTRYYYDPNLGKCVNFLYDGLGNFNNFITKFDCENYCSRLMCPFGNPLMVGEEWQKCESSTDCPSSHVCDTTHRVCCPTAQNICSQPKRPGECKNSVRKYWYNIEMRQCQIFEYSGCNGNDNNFDSLPLCQQTCRNIALEPKCLQGKAHRDVNGNFFTCSSKHSDQQCPPNYYCYFDGNSYGCCPTKSYTCSLNSDKGVQCGAGTSFKYYFNPNKNSCEAFQYLGCDGNSNNFQTLEACEEYCGIVCPHGGQPLRDVSTNQLITCSNSNKCIDTHECVTLNSNGNVVQRCCPSKSYICSMPPQQGTLCTKMPLTRYYFNIVTKECAKFSYNGCNGNLNNWPSIEQCRNFCYSSACSPGDIVYINPNTNLPYECNTALTNTCPTNFQCLFDQLTQSAVCCGASSMGVCPDGEKAFVNAADMSVRECLVNVEGSCPANYLCRFNPLKNRYYCCSSISGELCPSGKAVARDNSNKNPIRCHVNGGSNQCPNGYSCQTSVPGALQGYCCSSNYVCPNKGDFYIEESSQMPRSCTPGAFVGCPGGYSCQRTTPDSSTGYCCKGEITAVSDGCPPNQYAYMKNYKVVECDPFNIQNNPCPKSYTCQWGKDKYQCCGKEPIFESIEESSNYGCPNFQVAFINKTTKSPEFCSSSIPNSCPLGYFCQFVNTNQYGSNKYICCGNKSECPGDSVGYIDITGSPKECKMGFLNDCPEGFVCKSVGNKGKNICCTGTEDDFSNKKSALMNVAMNPVLVTTERAIISRSRYLKKQSRLLALANVTLPPLNIPPKRKIKKCDIKETIKNRKCAPRVIGDKCLKTIQCPETTECINKKCSCPSNKIERNGKCVDMLEEVDDEEFFEYEVEYDDESLICKTNEIKLDNKCYKKAIVGDKCEIDNQCINGASCINNLCYCPKNTAGYKKRCITNICGINNNRIPVLLANSKALLCHRKTCPNGSICLKSSLINDYVCCSTVDSKGTGNKKIVKKKVLIKNKKNNTTITMEGSKCRNEIMPLLDKNTKSIISCSNKKPCPKNYVCVKDQCCRSETKIFSGIYMDTPNIILPPKSDVPLCDEDHVLVTYDDNGQNVYSCEIECPDKQSPLDGICISDN